MEAKKTAQSIDSSLYRDDAFSKIAKVQTARGDLDKAKKTAQFITDSVIKDKILSYIADAQAFIADGADVSTYTGNNELVLNIQKIENGDVIDSDVDVDFDLLTHRFMAIIKQKAILKKKNGGHNVPTLKDMCWKKVTEDLKNGYMFIKFINKVRVVLPDVEEVKNMPLFQYLRKHTQCTAAAAGGAEESKRTRPLFPRKRLN